MLALSREQVRAFDSWAVAQLGVPGVVLMENAGRGCAEVLLQVHAASVSATASLASNKPGSGVSNAGSGEWPSQSFNRRLPKLVAICCGRGNNGGDGYVMARHLALAGVSVRVLAFANPDELSGDALWAAQVYRRLGWSVLPCWQTPVDEQRLRHLLADCDWIVDALFGTGLKGPLRSPFDRVVEILNASGKPILAVDIPSGLDCDTGQPLGPTIRAQCTATMAACKLGFLREQARAFTGEVHVVSLGVPVEAWLHAAPGATQNG